MPSQTRFLLTAFTQDQGLQLQFLECLTLYKYMPKIVDDFQPINTEAVNVTPYYT